ncbi:MAG: TRC40/GET3/ArsA family transport-energizing ATPase [Brevefilum sp.]|nr:TRC40/GET3/ArsA family transport-energizing ATPase [Brevefilum sp.]
MTISTNPTQHLFFSGKGGVGKTSMACVQAVRVAEEGIKTLIVTTDPASNLADVFEQDIGHQITPINGLDNLWAMEIDSDKATQEYIDRAMEPIRAVFPEQMVQVMEEQMSGPCTSEVAAFDRFTDFLDTSANEKVTFDIIIFDTAPTGHTIRLLELPAEWSHSIDEASAGSGQTCLGPAAAIQEAKQKYERALAAMRNSEQTEFVFVLHPEAISIKETRRAIGELGKLEINNFSLIVNSIIPPQVTDNELFAARSKMQTVYLQQIKDQLKYTTRFMPLLASEIKGLDKLTQVGKIFFDGQNSESFHFEDLPILDERLNLTPIDVVRERIQPNGHHRTVFFAGKGGVGKTVSSCITAVWLARQGYRTLLLTTDPAAHLGDVLDSPVNDEVKPVEGQPNLWAVKIDPKAAAEQYKARILEDARQRGRPSKAIGVMEEELNSPCTEEMAAFDKFIEYASQDEWESVVFDTAPTGHTVRMLELPMDWSKQIDVKVFGSVDTNAADDVTKQRFEKVIDMMRDPERSTFAFVMYPEATPIIEAFRAVSELSTVGIETNLVVANMVIPSDQINTSFSRARRQMQEKYLLEMDKRFHLPVVQIPLMPQEVKGLDMLIELGQQIYGDEGE